MNMIIAHPFGLTVLLPSSLALQTMMIVIIHQPSGPDSVPLSVHPFFESSSLLPLTQLPFRAIASQILSSVDIHSSKYGHRPI